MSDLPLLDPRVKHAKKRPRTAPQFVRLAQDVAHLGALVHARLDNLGAPRTLDGGELTLLGRLDLWLDDVEVEFTTARVLRNMQAAMDGPRALRSKADYMALPGVVAVGEPGPYDVELFVERGMTTAEIDALSQIVQARRQVNVIVEIERDRRSAERRERHTAARRDTRPPVIGERWRPKAYAPGERDVWVLAVDGENATHPPMILVRGTRPPSVPASSSHPFIDGTWRIPLADFLADYRRAA